MKRLILVDGYNVLNAWRGMLEGRSLEAARDELVRALHDYAGATGQKAIVVFDAYQTDRLGRCVTDGDIISVVFTSKGETADHYIERMCDSLKESAGRGKLSVRVATSDALEQTIVMGRGAERLSARELFYEVEAAKKTARRMADGVQARGKGSIMDQLRPEVREKLNEMRRGTTEDKRK